MHTIVTTAGWELISPNDMLPGLPSRAINDNFISIAAFLDISGEQLKIHNLADPANPQDAATKNYVDMFYNNETITNLTPSGGGGAQFNGSNWLSGLDTLLPNGTNPCTMLFTMKPASLPGSQCSPFEYGTMSYGQARIPTLLNSGQMVFDTYANGTGASGVFAGGNTYSISISIDSSGNVIIYVNGSVILSGPVSSPGACNTVLNGIFYIAYGEPWGGGGTNFVGNISQVAVYDQVLNPTDCVALTTTENPGTYTNTSGANLVAYFPLTADFDDHSGFSGAAQTLTNYNGVTITSGGSGSANFSQTCFGSAYKKVIIYCDNLVGSVTYTFPIAFTYAPQIVSQSLSSIATATTTDVTVAGISSTGFIELSGY